MILVSEVGEGNQQEGGICQGMSSGQAWEEKERNRVGNNERTRALCDWKKRKISQMLGNQSCQTLLLAVAQTHFVLIAFWNVLCFHQCNVLNKRGLLSADLVLRLSFFLGVCVSQITI